MSAGALFFTDRCYKLVPQAPFALGIPCGRKLGHKGRCKPFPLPVSEIVPASAARDCEAVAPKSEPGGGSGDPTA